MVSFIDAMMHAIKRKAKKSRVEKIIRKNMLEEIRSLKLKVLYVEKMEKKVTFLLFF